MRHFISYLFVNLFNLKTWHLQEQNLLFQQAKQGQTQLILHLDEKNSWEVPHFSLFWYFCDAFFYDWL